MEYRLYDMLEGAGLGHLSGGCMCGGSAASAFIGRMMAENRVKHKGKYGPSAKAPKDSEMSSKKDFNWRKLANASQKGHKGYSNQKGEKQRNPYGASPFILDHFGPGKRPTKIQTHCRTQMNGIFKHERGKQNVERCGTEKEKPKSQNILQPAPPTRKTPVAKRTPKAPHPTPATASPRTSQFASAKSHRSSEFVSAKSHNRNLN